MPMKQQGFVCLCLYDDDDPVDVDVVVLEHTYYTLCHVSV